MSETTNKCHECETLRNIDYISIRLFFDRKRICGT